MNVVGTWLACRAAAKPMREAGYGRILTVASALDLVGAAGRGGYAASKGAVVPISPFFVRRLGAVTGAVLVTGTASGLGQAIALDLAPAVSASSPG